mgnify:CR=1 FL=1
MPPTWKVSWRGVAPRPVWWRLARTELNYRRFFSISELIGVRVEDPEVFEATHDKILELLHEGVIDGLRIDHPDGLADPEGYLRDLRRATRVGTAIWVEKILEGSERLPEHWPCEGTTGYDALHAVTAALIDPTTAPLIAAPRADARALRAICSVAITTMAERRFGKIWRKKCWAIWNCLKISRFMEIKGMLPNPTETY